MIDPVENLPSSVVVDDGLLRSSIRSMLGTPPANLEFIEYVVSAAVLIILFALVASVFVGFSKMFGAR